MELLKMQYTTGVNDGTFVDYEYAYPTVTTYYLQDTFSTFDTTNTWYPAVSYQMYSGNTITANSGKLELTGRSNIYKQGGVQGTQTRTRFTPPLTIKFDTEWVSRPASGHPAHAFEFTLTPSYYSSGYALWRKYDSIRIQHLIGPTSNNYGVVKRDTKGKDVAYVKPVTNNTTILNWQIDIGATGYTYIRLDTGSGMNTIWQGNLGLTNYKNLYLGMSQYATDNVAKTVKTSFIDVYTTWGDEFRNVNSLPVTTKLGTSSDFTRASEDGNIPCYLNKNVPLKFQITPSDLYKGAVKTYSTNYPDSTERLLTTTNHKLASGKFHVKNGLLDLNLTATGVELKYWNGSSYTTLNTFTKGGSNWDLMKLNYVSPDLTIFQTDNIKWYVPRGKPFVYVEHPNQDISYWKNSTMCYWHDGTTLDSPAGNVDVTMTNDWYCGIWDKGSGTCASPNPANNYRLLILQQKPTTIKSDKIPACNLTGIGWYDNTKSSGDGNHYYSIAKEWVYRTQTSLGVN
jgi:hypothetical protein